MSYYLSMEGGGVGDWEFLRLGFLRTTFFGGACEGWKKGGKGGGARIHL